MTHLLLSLRSWSRPFLIASLLFLGVAGASMATALVAAPAHAADLTADDLLPTEFGTSTGLGDANIKTTIGNLIKVALGFLGVVAVVIILWGGFTWMTAGGSEDKVKDAQRIIAYGAIGLAIILSAWAITNFVIGEFLNATTTSITE